MILRLVSGSRDARERVEEAVGGVDGVQARARGGHEVALHLLALARPQQAVVDEHAGQPVADGPLDEGGGHRGVDAAGQPADRPPVADLRAHGLDRLVDDRRGGPARRDPRDLVQEALQHLLPVRRVPDLGVVLDAREPPVGVLERRDGRALGRRGDGEPVRRADDRVAVAHPHGVARREAVVQHAAVDPQLGAAVLAGAVVRHVAAQRQRHGLEAVAQAQHRDARLEQGGVDARRAVGVHAGGPAGEDHRGGLARDDVLDGRVAGHDLGVHLRLTHAAGDQLGVLGAVVDDEHRGHLHGPQDIDAGQGDGRTGGSAPPCAALITASRSRRSGPIPSAPSAAAHPASSSP